MRLQPMSLDVLPAALMQAFGVGDTATVLCGHEVCVSSAVGNDTKPLAGGLPPAYAVPSLRDGFWLLHTGHCGSMTFSLKAMPVVEASPLWEEASTQDEHPEPGEGTLHTWT